MKFPDTTSPTRVPGVTDDRKRIVLIVVVAIVGYLLYTYAGTFEEIWEEISTEIQQELGIDTGYEYEPEAVDVPVYEPEQVEPPPLQRTGTTTTTTTIETDLPEEAAREMLRESRQDIIEQLHEQGQEDQIPVVLEALDRMEEAYE